MTSHTPGSRAESEGTSLPPPRPFGEANTLTLPRRRRHAPAQGNIVRVTPAEEAGAALRVEIVRTEAAVLTVTF